MILARLKDNAPALLLALASAALAVAFCLPIGGERLARTRYQRLEGFAASFEPQKPAGSPDKEAAPARGEAWGLVAQAVRQRYTPVQANALLSRVESLAKGGEDAGKAAPRRGEAKARKPAARAPAVATSSAPAKPEASSAVPPPAPAASPAQETWDTMSEQYENDPAKYSLDASAAQGAVTLRLRGLSRAGGRYVLKVAVSNRGGDDFFVRELVVRVGQELVGAKSYVRLFVEPGRTREGFVVFDKPRTGADVHVALKEDREKGRVVELPVPYPF